MTTTPVNTFNQLPLDILKHVARYTPALGPLSQTSRKYNDVAMLSFYERIRQDASNLCMLPSMHAHTCKQLFSQSNDQQSDSSSSDKHGTALTGSLSSPPSDEYPYTLKQQAATQVYKTANAALGKLSRSPTYVRPLIATHPSDGVKTLDAMLRYHNANLSSQAGKDGNVDLLEMLQATSGLPAFTSTWAFNAAVRHGHVNIINALQNTEISPFSAGCALNDAVRKGDPAMVETLKTMQPVADP